MNCKSHILFTQLSSFQAILATDEKISFAIFQYENPENLLDLNSQIFEDYAGFSSGRKHSGDIIHAPLMDAKMLNVFRIDGKHIFC